MASCFYLLNQFDDVLVYLESIKTYYYNDDSFNYNYGQALAAVGHWKEAEEAFQLVQSDALKADYAYLSWIARCCAFRLGFDASDNYSMSDSFPADIMTRKARLAWELYLKMDSSSESYGVLRLIANDCYKVSTARYHSQN
jgi:intraflagellar transport protein 56